MRLHIWAGSGLACLGVISQPSVAVTRPAAGRPVASFVTSMTSVILSPIMLWLEVVALLFSSMVVAEPANPLFVKAITVVVVVVLGLLALALPVAGLVMGSRARKVAQVEPHTGAGMALAALVIGGVVSAVVLLVQGYLVLWAAGVCSLEGC